MRETHYTAYIDEAGDEGFGKLRSERSSGQSNWLAIGACIVSQRNDSFLPQWRNEILAQFGGRGQQAQRRDLHFRDLNHDQKVVACQFLADKPLGLCVVLSNKVTILGAREVEIFKRKGHLYNYLVRFLLERVTASCAVVARKSGVDNPQLKLVFSRRGGTDYQSIKNYLELMRDGREKLQPVRSIDWAVLNPENIAVESHGKWAGLQIADVMTSAIFTALEPNYYGNYEHRYALELRNKLIKSRGSMWSKSSALNCGLTLIPPYARNPLDDEQKRFIGEITK